MIDISLLKEQPFLSDLTDGELALIATVTQKEAFTAGQTIFKTSDPGEALFIIRSGEVKVCMAATDGELFTLTILREGDIFGAMSFIDAKPRSATIIAISDVDTYVIHRPDAEKIANDNPRILYKLMRNIIRTVHDVVYAMNSRHIEMINYMWGRKRFT
jgi:CRP/FNR family cyclic AMP-dependent transcriptional regulator